MLLAAAITALGVVMWDMVIELRDLKAAQQSNEAWTYRIEQNEKKIEVLNGLHIHPTHKLIR